MQFLSFQWLIAGSSCCQKDWIVLYYYPPPAYRSAGGHSRITRSFTVLPHIKTVIAIKVTLNKNNIDVKKILMKIKKITIILDECVSKKNVFEYSIYLFVCSHIYIHIILFETNCVLLGTYHEYLHDSFEKVFRNRVYEIIFCTAEIYYKLTMLWKCVYIFVIYLWIEESNCKCSISSIFLVDQVMEGLLSKESYEKPSDTVSHEKLVMELPKWYDEKLFKK